MMFHVKHLHARRTGRAGGTPKSRRGQRGRAVVMARPSHELVPERRASMHPAPILLDTGAWIGANATILPGVTIGNNAVVPAGAAVTSDVEENATVGGVPARFIERIDRAAT